MCWLHLCALVPLLGQCAICLARLLALQGQEPHPVRSEASSWCSLAGKHGGNCHLWEHKEWHPRPGPQRQHPLPRQKKEALGLRAVEAQGSRQLVSRTQRTMDGQGLDKKKIIITRMNQESEDADPSSRAASHVWLVLCEQPVKHMGPVVLCPVPLPQCFHLEQYSRTQWPSGHYRLISVPSFPLLLRHYSCVGP